MIGALVGDVVGSIYEWDNIKTKEFPFFSEDCFFTDDSVMTLAVAKSLIESKGDKTKLKDLVLKNFKFLGRRYPNAGYGGRFGEWIESDDTKPYNSFGNGSAMRVSPCGDIASSLEEAIELSRIVTEVTHNHPEGIKGAEAVSVSIFLARHGKSKEEIRTYINDNYYKLDFTLDEIRPTYTFNETCQGSVKEAIVCFLESNSFIDAIRNAISIGGDSDTIACITGSIAEAYYKVPKKVVVKLMDYFTKDLKDIMLEFNKTYFE